MIITADIGYRTIFTIRDISRKTGLCMDEVIERCIKHSFKMRYVDGDLFEHRGKYFYSNKLSDFPY